MLKNTLRKMTRFSMGSNVKRKDSSDQESDTAEPKSRSRNPFTGKSRVPKSQSPAPSGVARSKSFKEPGPPVSRTNNGTSGVGSYSRNNVYTSSLRRTKNKQREEEKRLVYGIPLLLRHLILKLLLSGLDLSLYSVF